MIELSAEVKDAIRSGEGKPNEITIAVYNADGTGAFFISNENLVYESFKIDERMCSTDDIKFGLCEGSSVEFQYFGKPSIKGKTIIVYINVSDSEQILLGEFKVTNCDKQISTGIYKAVAYNKLRSEYLDEEVDAVVQEIVSDGDIGTAGTATVQTVIDKLLDNYAIDAESPSISVVSISKTQSEIYSYSYKEVVDGKVTNNQVWGYRGRFKLTIEDDNFSTEDFYRVVFNGKAIYDYLKGKREDPNSYQVYLNGSATAQKYLTALNSLDYSDKSVGSQGTVHTYYTLEHLDRRYPKFEIVQARTGRTIYDSGNLESINGMHATPWFTNLEKDGGVLFDCTVQYAYSSSASPTRADLLNNFKKVLNDISDYFKVEKRVVSPASKIRLTSELVNEWEGLTPRQLISSVYETICSFGKLNRSTNKFSPVELEGIGLTPADNLYPSDSLYPDETSESTNKSVYQRLWTDDNGVQTWRTLYVTYKTLDEEGNDIERILERTVNANGTTDYHMSDNWLFRNMIWSASDVGAYADAMVLKMRPMKWFPFEIECSGLPYLETGDMIEIHTDEGTYPSYVLQRHLKGIHNLTDTISLGTLEVF